MLGCFEMSLEKYYPQGDFEEWAQFSLTEKQWHVYLSAIDAEAGKFFKLFILTRHIANHLDMIFAKMKWDRVVSGMSGRQSIMSDVVTFHKNPIYIATRSVCYFLEKILELLFSENKTLVVKDYWGFIKCINDIRCEMICGVANIDVGECLLAICHFKQAISYVNNAIVLAGQMPKFSGKMNGLKSDIGVALFDIRDLAWYGIAMSKHADCRNDDE